LIVLSSDENEAVRAATLGSLDPAPFSHIAAHSEKWLSRFATRVLASAATIHAHAAAARSIRNATARDFNQSAGLFARVSRNNS
jgi:hypothetical protein